MKEQTPKAVENVVQPLAAPNRLTSDHRVDFRRAVLEHLESVAAKGAGVIAVDLARTIELDASGLGVLVLLQKRARERGLRTRLINAPRAVRETLQLTRLDTLFEIKAND